MPLDSLRATFLSMSQKYPGPVQLHSDFNVDLNREKEFLEAYANFKAIVSKAAGFRACRLLKIRPADQHEHGAGVHPAQIGPTIDEIKYRLIQEWDAEDVRWKWNPTEDHHKAWHPLEKPLLKGTKDHMKGWLFTAYLFDVKG